MDYGERKLLFIIICTYCIHVHLSVGHLILDALLCEAPSFCTVYYLLPAKYTAHKPCVFTKGIPSYS